MKTILKLGFFVFVSVQAATGQASPTVTSMAAGLRHTLVLESDSSLWAMGNNDAGQLGGNRVTGNRVTPPETVANDGTNNFIVVNPPSGTLFFHLKQ